MTTTAGAARLGENAVGLAPWQSLNVQAPPGRRLRITATPARHGPVGIEPISGDVTGFVLTPEEGRAPAAYVSGNTVWYEGVAEVARRFDVRAAVLFTGSAEPRQHWPGQLDKRHPGRIGRRLVGAIVTCRTNVQIESVLRPAIGGISVA